MTVAILLLGTIIIPFWMKFIISTTTSTIANPMRTSRNGKGVVDRYFQLVYVISYENII